jgi:hypothetical protein
LQPQTRAEARAVGGGALVFGTLFLDRLAPLYLIVIIREEEALGPGALAMIPLVIGIGWAVAMTVGRWTRGRWSDRSRIAIGAGGAALFHVASALVGAWPAFLVLRFLGGILAGTVAPPVTGLIFAWAPPRRRGLDAGIMFSSTRLLGSLVAPVLVLAVAVRAGWQTALLVSALLLLLATIAFLAVSPAGPARPSTAADAVERREQARTVLAPHGSRNVALATVFGILFAGWLTIVSQFGPSVVVSSLEVTPDRAGAIVGGFGIGGWIAALTVPALSDRIGRGGAVGGASAIGGTAALVLTYVLAAGPGSPTWVPTLLFALGGIALGALPLALSVIPGEAVLRGDPGGAVTWPVVGAEVIGAAVLPALALLGFLPERTSIAAAGLALLVSAGLAAALVPPARHGDATLDQAASPEGGFRAP